MQNTKTKNIISLILNIITILFTAAAVGAFFVGDGASSGMGNMQCGGVKCFKFFTIDSNILAAICCAIIIPYNIREIKTGKNRLSAPAVMLKFVGSAAVALTFTVVVVYLGPITGYDTAYEGSCLALHLICPLTAIISFCMFENSCKITKKQAMLGVIPMVIYGCVYLTNVIITKAWGDFYHFNIGGFWYITVLIMLGLTYLLSLGLVAWHNKNIKI